MKRYRYWLNLIEEENTTAVEWDLMGQSKRVEDEEITMLVDFAERPLTEEQLNLYQKHLTIISRRGSIRDLNFTQLLLKE